MGALTHLDESGQATMVDVGDKQPSIRVATARGEIYLQSDTLNRIARGDLPKGDVFAVARIAGIQAAKRTWELIPLCHPINLASIKIEFTVLSQEGKVEIAARARAIDRTGVEMEALTAVGVAGLTIYDMVKSIDRSATLSQIRLESKSGGKSGEWRAPAV